MLSVSQRPPHFLSGHRLSPTNHHPWIPTDVALATLDSQPSTLDAQEIFNGGLTYQDNEQSFCQPEDECYGVPGGDQEDPSGTSCEGKIGQTLDTVPLVFGHWRATDFTRDVRKCPMVGCKGGNNKSFDSKVGRGFDEFSMNPSPNLNRDSQIH